MRWRKAQRMRKAPSLKRPSGGFSLIELLIVVAIILIIAAIAIPNFMRSRMAANEAATVQNMRNISTAEVAYSTTYGIGFSATLPDLGPGGGGPPTPTGAQLIDDILATGVKAGFTLSYSSSAPSNGVIFDYTLNADPTTVGVTGSRHFFSDQTGVIRQNVAAKATVLDTPI